MKISDFMRYICGPDVRAALRLAGRSGLRLSLLAGVSVWGYGAAGAFVVRDAESRLPLPFASVVDADNRLAGVTDADGVFDAPVDVSLPLTVSYIGYGDVAVNDASCGEVLMLPVSVSLPEVVVNSDVAGVKIVCDAKVHVVMESVDFTSDMAGSYLVDFVLPVGEKKVKGFEQKRTPHVIESDVVGKVRFPDGREENAQGSDIVDMILSSISYPEKDVILPDELARKGSGEVKVSDKKGKENTYRLTPEGLFRSRDVLAGKKNHKMSPNFLKLIGATIDFTRMDIVSLYVDGEDGVYRPWNLAAETMVVEVLARGKLYKMVYGGDGDISTRMVVELHPREVQYVTVEESKALAKRKRWEE